MQGLQGGTRWAGHSLHLILQVEQAHHLQQTEEESEEEKPSQADKVPRLAPGSWSVQRSKTDSFL